MHFTRPPRHLPHADATCVCLDRSSLVDFAHPLHWKHTVSYDDVTMFLECAAQVADHCICAQVFMLSADAILNIDTLSELLASGHSRVPVHVPGDSLARQLICLPACLLPAVLCMQRI